MFSRARLKCDFRMNLKRAIKFLPRSLFQLVISVLNCISSCGLPSEFFPQILKGTNSPLGCSFKGQFELQCRIGAMARPGLDPVMA